MEQQHPHPQQELQQYPTRHRSYNNHHHHDRHQMKMTSQSQPPQPPDNGRSSVELQALDCNLASLCDHILSEGFNNGLFSDIVVHAMGSPYRLHRLILSRSSYFRNMLYGPWKEASAPVVTLQIDDKNVDAEAIAMALAFIYGHFPKLNDNNAFRVLAAASFLDLQDLCIICTDFIIAELWTSNFLAYQVFAENQDYGIYGERVRSACWGYLCQSGFMELKGVLPKLSSQTLHALLTSNELWVPSEEKRFELALYTLLKKSALGHAESQNHQIASVETGVISHHDLSESKGKSLVDAFCSRDVETNPGCVQQMACSETNMGTGYLSNIEQPAELSNSFSVSDRSRSSSCSYVGMPVTFASSEQGGVAPAEGPSEESICYHFSNSNWITENNSGLCSSVNSSCNEIMPSDWGRNDLPLSWGGRIVAKKQAKGYGKGDCGLRGEEYDTFINIFEGGSVLYCNMSFEALLNVRKQLEELGFPCKAVNDALWLQMLLSQRVQEIGAETCRSCCLLGMACACKQPFALSHGVASTGYYMQAPDQHNPPNNFGNLYVADSAQLEGNGVSRPVRVHVRGSNDGLAGIGRGATIAPAAAWPPTRFVFSRVPIGVGNRNGQQSLANDDQELRLDQHGDMSGVGGLTALVGLSDGGLNVVNVHGGQTGRGYQRDLRNGFDGTSAAGPTGSGAQMAESSEQDVGVQWENIDNASISLDMKTPLSHFPPFRFGVEFGDVHRLSDGQVKHSPEVFYAGSFWKISVQAFNDEDPQGRRTLGLFIHRRRAEIGDPPRKMHMYVDPREKVTARYQLICPSKREVLVLGSFKQAGTLLPKAPKGWGWRSALLFDELPDLLQNGCLRVSAVVQLV